MNIFEQASKQAIRFETSVGNITTEDLWSLPLTSEKRPSLDTVARAINRELKEADEESFVVSSNKQTTLLRLKLDIVKHVIGVKLEEQQAERAKAANKQQKEKLLQILADKQDAELRGKDISEIEEMLKAL